MRDLLRLPEHELARPSDLPGGRIVLEVATRLAPGLRARREDLGLFVPGTGAGEAFAERQKQPGVPFQPDLPPDDRYQEALLAGQDPQPRPGVGGDPHIRLADQPILNLERSVSDADRSPALFRS